MDEESAFSQVSTEYGVKHQIFSSVHMVSTECGVKHLILD